MSSYTQLPLIVLSQTCSKCGESKPLAAFSLRSGTKNGHRSDCKACRKLRAAVWYQANAKRLNALSRANYKQHADANRDYALRRYYEHHEEGLAYRREYRQRPGMKELTRVRTNSWRARNPDKQKAATANRSARLRGAKIRDFTLKQWREQVAYFGGYCAYCNKRMEKPTKDHMLPLCQGGDHTLSNIVPSCLSCNVRKQGRNLAQVLMAGGDL